LDTAIRTQFPIQIPGDLPRIAIEISAIARIATPVCFLRRVKEGCTSRLGFG
jgi:hypothetical protein